MALDEEVFGVVEDDELPHPQPDDEDGFVVELEDDEVEGFVLDELPQPEELEGLEELPHPLLEGLDDEELPQLLLEGLDEEEPPQPEELDGLEELPQPELEEERELLEEELELRDDDDDDVVPAVRETAKTVNATNCSNFFMMMSLDLGSTKKRITPLRISPYIVLYQISDFHHIHRERIGSLTISTSINRTRCYA